MKPNAKLVLCKPKSPFLILSPIIMWFQGLPFSHSVILYNGMIYESTFPFSKKTPLAEFRLTYTAVEIHNVLIDPNTLEAMLDRPYSVLQLFWALFDVKSILNGKRFLMCTELCARAMGYNKKDADSVDLKDLKQLALSQQEQFYS